MKSKGGQIKNKDRNMFATIVEQKNRWAEQLQELLNRPFPRVTFDLGKEDVVRYLTFSLAQMKLKRSLIQWQTMRLLEVMRSHQKCQKQCMTTSLNISENFYIAATVAFRKAELFFLAAV